MDVVVLLEAFPEDVTAKDVNGDSSVHVAASAVDYELVKVWLVVLDGQTSSTRTTSSSAECLTILWSFGAPCVPSPIRGDYCLWGEG